jgi:hypothetical protein
LIARVVFWQSINFFWQYYYLKMPFSSTGVFAATALGEEMELVMKVAIRQLDIYHHSHGQPYHLTTRMDMKNDVDELLM